MQWINFRADPKLLKISDQLFVIILKIAELLKISKHKMLFIGTMLLDRKA